MSFGLGHGNPLDDAPGVVGVSRDELGPLPDDALTNPESALVDPRTWFDDPGRPFELEIGSGKGTFLVQQAGLQPETNFLGIEWAGEFYRYAADRVRRRRAGGELTNVRLWHGDATELLRWRMPPAVCRVIHLYFSDPWPKSRHHKKRVVQHAFLADAYRALEPGGELRVVTDHADLWAWDEAHFQHWATGEPNPPEGIELPPIGLPPDRETARAGVTLPCFERSTFEKPPSAGDDELVGTNFERKFRREGRQFYSVTLRKPSA